MVKASNEITLHLHVQRTAFAYFEFETNLDTGLVLDKNAPDWPASIAATGLALSCYPIAIERGLMDRRTALARTLTTLRFFVASPQGEQPDATGYRGFYYHFLDSQTGKRAWNCELSSVDTAFLISGVLAAAAYFQGDDAQEREIRELADTLYRRVEWDWLLDETKRIRHGWRPETGFIPYHWEGYDESLLMHVLALGSPTHPVPATTYDAWSSTFAWKNCYDIDYLYSAPLFTHHLSHVWLDLRGIQDSFMQKQGIDYFENSRRATEIQRRYAIENPLGFKGYGEHGWGITASDGPGPATRMIDGIERQFFDYVGRGAPYGVVRGDVPALCTRYRGAGTLLLRAQAKPSRCSSLRLSLHVQPHVWRTGQPMRMEIAVARRPEYRADRHHDREPSHRDALATDAQRTVHCGRIAQSGFSRRLAFRKRVTRSIQLASALSTICCASCRIAFRCSSLLKLSP
jgi:hypothetical protein